MDGWDHHHPTHSLFHNNPFRIFSNKKKKDPTIAEQARNTLNIDAINDMV
jgi:hypothetical protein